MTRALAAGFWSLSALALAQSIEEQREIAARKHVTLGDAVLLFHALVFEPDPDMTREKAFELLSGKGTVPEGWKDRLAGPATLGEVCYLVVRTLNVSGGLTMRVFGPSPRLAYRECLRAQLVPPGGPNGRVSGRVLIGLVGRVEELLERR